MSEMNNMHLSIIGQLTAPSTATCGETTCIIISNALTFSCLIESIPNTIFFKETGGGGAWGRKDYFSK